MEAGKDTVAVGMSGGTDSSMAAYLLHEQGFTVVGITMRLWQEPSARSSADHLERARHLAETLGIRHEVLDLTDAFRTAVVQPFVAAYCDGLTPSPCVSCNVLVKFGLMLDAALALGCSRLATGHYARLDTGLDGRVRLHRGRDPGKDQSYFLAGLRQDQLARAVFPLGSLTKARVVAEARRLGLVPHGLAESQDLCFIPDGDVLAFLHRAAGPRLPGPGEIVARDGRVLGQHRGAVGFTVGQRRGLGLAGGPWYVVSTDPRTNRVVVGERDTCVSRDVPLRDVNWLRPPPAPGEQIEVQAQIRYAMRAAPATLAATSPTEGLLRFAAPVHAVTPGQFAVMYQGDEVLAGGWIAPVALESGREGPAA
jgi:tRNA-specific 2-thiouridylase